MLLRHFLRPLLLLLLLLLLPAVNSVKRRFSGTIGARSLIDILADPNYSDHAAWSGEEPDWFGWKPGGTLSLTINVSQAPTLTLITGQSLQEVDPVSLLLVTFDERTTALDTFTATSPDCHLPSLARFEVYTAGTLSLTSTFPTTRISLLLLNCHDVPAHFNGELHVRQGDGSELSSDYARLVPVYFGVFFMYLVYLIAWSFGLYRVYPHVAPPQVCVLPAVALRMVMALVLFFFYRALNTTGRVEHGTAALVRAVEDVSDVAGLVSFILFSVGWHISRRVITGREWRMFGALLSVYVFLSIVTWSCESEQSCKIAQLFKYVFLSFILIGCLVAMNCTVLYLRSMVMQPYYLNLAPLKLVKRLSQFSSFRVTFVWYLLVPTAAVATNTTLDWQDRWAFVFGRRASLCLLEGVMLLAFRPSKNSSIFIRAQPQQEQDGDDDNDNAAAAADDDDDDAPDDPAAPLASPGPSASVAAAPQPVGRIRSVDPPTLDDD